MIVYHGSIRKFDHFHRETVVQKLPNEINTIGLWFTSDLHSAKLCAIGTETVIEKSKTEFWEDGEPKVVQFDRPVCGYIYKVYIDEPNLKEYQTYDLFMNQRDEYCDYFSKGKKQLSWKDQATLLNKEEANAAFRTKLIKQGYEGLVIRNHMLESIVTDMYCLFSEDALFIADVIQVDEIDGK